MADGSEATGIDVTDVLCAIAIAVVVGAIYYLLSRRAQRRAENQVDLMAYETWQNSQRTADGVARIEIQLSEMRTEVASQSDVSGIEAGISAVRASMARHIRSSDEPPLDDVLRYRVLGDRWSELCTRESSAGALLEDGSISVESIQRLHTAIFPESYPWAGRLRDRSVYISASTGTTTRIVDQAELRTIFHPVEADQIEENLERLCTDWNSRHETLQSYQPAGKAEELAHFHHEFEIVHPFLDGNGRVGRIIMQDQASFLFGTELRFELGGRDYYESLRACNEGNVCLLRDQIMNAIRLQLPESH